jgi:hypothetical protein
MGRNRGVLSILPSLLNVNVAPNLRSAKFFCPFHDLASGKPGVSLSNGATLDSLPKKRDNQEDTVDGREVLDLIAEEMHVRIAPAI